MIGPKKLSAIRQDLRRALAATGADPIRWLDERIAEAGPTGKTEVLHSIQSILASSDKSGRPRGRVRTKK